MSKIHSIIFGYSDRNKQHSEVKMKEVLIALVLGDGSGPEMMNVACEVVKVAAEKDGYRIGYEATPMGWNAYKLFGDTRPGHSFLRAKELGLIFFGGVGDPKLDNTIGKDHPEMKPEPRCLLALRKDMGLLLNFRPMIYYKALAHLANVKPEMIPEEGIKQVWIRFLLEDSYFGNFDLKNNPGIWGMSQGGSEQVLFQLDLIQKDQINGSEDVVTDISYYQRSTVEKYIRAAFAYARSTGLPLISIDKANVMARYEFWRRIVTNIGKTQFPDVALSHQFVDSANALLFTPAKLHGVIACGNEHGDILSDGAAAALGSMGMMCSSAINPDTGAAMFESGAGTAPTLAGQDKANPIGRILTGAMMLRHIGAVNGAEAIESAVQKVLQEGYRTGDLVTASNPDASQLVGTRQMGQLIIERL